jgi:Flp pilus assembly protein TadD
VRSARWKYTAEPQPVELYDVQEDPGETRNLADEQPEVRADLARLYHQVLASQPALESELRALDADEAEQLAALGYVDAATPDVAAGAGFDPRRFVKAHSWTGRARTLAQKGEFERAIELLETLAEAPAVQTLALRSLAPIYAEAGRRDNAIDTYRRYIELTNAPEARIGLARMLLLDDEPAQALAELEQIETPTPGSETLHAFALQSLGRGDEARRVVDAAFPGPHEQRNRLRTRAQLVLRGDPSPDAEAELRELVQGGMEDPVLRSRLGSYLSKSKDERQREEALDLLRSAASEEPGSAELQSSLGWGLVRLGLDEEAIDPFEEALRLDPKRHADQARLARVLADTGENEEALALLRSALAAQPAASWSDEARTLEAQLADAVSSSNAGGKGV